MKLPGLSKLETVNHALVGKNAAGTGYFIGASFALRQGPSDLVDVTA